MTTEIAKSVNKIDSIKNHLKTEIFVERDLEINAIWLSIIGNTNVLLLGEPGVGKSLLATQTLKHIKDAKKFQWMLTPFTAPDEIAGNISLKALENDQYKRNISNTMCDAHIAFLDEVWKGNSGVLNFLLPMLNERIYYNDGKPQKAPLLTVIGASNELPESDDNLGAALDRFVIKMYVDGVKEKSNKMIMMSNFLKNRSSGEDDLIQISLQEIHDLQEAARNVNIPVGVLKNLVKLQQTLESKHIEVSARVVHNTLRVMQANAVLNGRDVAEDMDIEIARHTFWKQPEHESIIYSEILNMIAPDKKKLEEELAKAEDIYREFCELDDDDDTDDVSGDGMKKRVGFLQGLKSVRKRIEKTSRDIQEKGKSTDYAKKCLDKIQRYTDEIYKDSGISVQ